MLDFLVTGAKLVTLAAVSAGAYYAYTVYDRRQPYEWSGSVELRTVAVGSRVGGRVMEIRVQEGQEVAPGDVIVVLEGTELQARREIAQSELETAEAGLEKLVHGARPDELAQATARLAETQAALGKASGLSAQQAKELARTRALFQSGSVSAAEEEMKHGAARAAQGGAMEAAANASQAAAALRLLTGGTRPEDLRAGRAQVAVAKGRMALVDGQIAELSIRAPHKARVERILVRPGDLLRADAPAASLLESGQLYVKIYVPETRLGKIHVGQEVPVTVDSYPNRSFKGRIEHINEIGEYTPRRLVTTEERADEVFAARVNLLEGETELRSGMAAFIHVAK